MTTERGRKALALASASLRLKEAVVKLNHAATHGNEASVIAAADEWERALSSLQDFRDLHRKQLVAKSIADRVVSNLEGQGEHGHYGAEAVRSTVAETIITGPR